MKSSLIFPGGQDIAFIGEVQARVKCEAWVSVWSEVGHAKVCAPCTDGATMNVQDLRPLSVAAGDCMLQLFRSPDPNVIS